MTDVKVENNTKEVPESVTNHSSNVNINKVMSVIDILSESINKNDDYEKLVDNEVDKDYSDSDSDSDSDSEEEEDTRWTTLQKLVDSHKALCESYQKLLSQNLGDSNE
jgi:hypothetical protein